MAAITRWVYFDPNTTTKWTAATNQARLGTGTRGYVEGTTTITGPITISSGINDQFIITINGGTAQQVTLGEGENLDPRKVAQEITWRLRTAADPIFDNVICEFINNRFRIYSSTLGTNSTVSLNNGANDALAVLGMATVAGGALTVNYVNGTATSNNAAYTGNLTVGGTYKGQLDDVITLFVGMGHPVADPTKTGLYAGTASTAGTWNGAAAETYTVTISTANGAVLNNGTGNVPTMTWTSTLGDNSTAAVDLLYSDYWYNVGTKGVRIKFTDAPFGANDTFTIVCTPIAEAAPGAVDGAIGTARLIWDSRLKGKSTTPILTATTPVEIGNTGITVAFTNAGVLTRRDVFTITCGSPQPTSIGTTLLDFGNVTVGSWSPIRSVIFEIISGASVLSTARFGLQSRDTLAHHLAGQNDTKISVGFGGLARPSADGTEWRSGLVGPDLNSDTPPAYLAVTEDNMSLSQGADDALLVGVVPGHMLTDFIHLAVRLGAAEVGSQTIVYRMWFDYY